MSLPSSPAHPRRSVARSRWSALAVLGLTGTLGLACGPRRSSRDVPVGVSRYDDPSEYGLGGAGPEAASGADARGPDAPSTGGSDGSTGGSDGSTGGSTTGGGTSLDTPPNPAELAAAREAKAREGEEAFAHQLLEKAVTPTDSAGLVFALGQRAADLPWTLVLQNRGRETLQVAADPHLLRFELSAPPSSSEPAAPSGGQAPRTSTPAARPLVCGPTQQPKSVADDAWLELGPGELVVHSFDPRSLCGEPGQLVQGRVVRATYGFPVEVKKVWSQGRASEVPQLDKPPFVARHPDHSERTTAPSPSPEELVAARLPKNLTAEPFELDETYPLEGVRTRPDAAGAASLDLGADMDGGAPDGAHPSSEPPPPPPLTLGLGSLPTVSEVDETTVQFTVKNQSGKSLLLFLRRELVAYEILGPRGATTCRMYPASRAPDKASYETLGPGSSRSLSTRLAEACPPDTFAQPGTYSVSARLEARSSGEEFGLAAFVGDVSTTRPIRFVIRGKAGSGAASFRPVAARP